MTGGKKARPAKRDRDGRYKPGNPPGPGNPNYKYIHQLRAGVRAACSPEQIEKALRKLEALLHENDDVPAGKVWLEYCVGRPKPAQNVPVAFPEIESVEDIPAAIRETVAAQSRGDITVDEMSAALNALENARKGFETAELVPRIEALERADRGDP